MSKEYHIILDELDRGNNLVAVCALQDWALKLSSREFRLLINAFVRRGVQLTTS